MAMVTAAEATTAVASETGAAMASARTSAGTSSSATTKPSRLPPIVDGLPTALELLQGMSDAALDARVSPRRSKKRLGHRMDDEHRRKMGATGDRRVGCSAEGGDETDETEQTDETDGGMAAQLECHRIFVLALTDAQESAGLGARPAALKQLQRAHRLLRRMNAPRWLLLRIRVTALVLEVSTRDNRYILLLEVSTRDNRYIPLLEVSTRDKRYIPLLEVSTRDSRYIPLLEVSTGDSRYIQLR